jgi:hypothetical protein
MTTTDPNSRREDFAAAHEGVRQAEAEVNRLRAKLRAELADQDARGISAEDRPQRLGWADGVAEARARYPKGEGTGNDPDVIHDRRADQRSHSLAAAGREEARRRYGQAP